jgi:hypothetical protein
MIDACKLRRARTVEDVVETTHDGRELFRGTKVGDRILSSDKNTLAPLKAAIGFEITQTLFSGKKVLLVERPSDLLYLKWFSERLAQRGRIALDADWTIAPCGEIQKMCALLSLMGEGRSNVAMLIDGAVGRKENALSQDDSELLRDCRVFNADMYVDVNGGSVEDLMGRRAYFSLVNSLYKLPRKFELREGGLIVPTIPVVTEVEDHLRSLPSGGIELNRYAPAEFLVENGKKLVKKLRDLEDGLDRFERFFADLNQCLSNEPGRLMRPGMDKYAQSGDSDIVEVRSRNASGTETYAVQR